MLIYDKGSYYTLLYKAAELLLVNFSLAFFFFFSQHYYSSMTVGIGGEGALKQNTMNQKVGLLYEVREKICKWWFTRNEVWVEKLRTNILISKRDNYIKSWHFKPHCWEIRIIMFWNAGIKLLVTLMELDSGSFYMKITQKWKISPLFLFRTLTTFKVTKSLKPAFHSISILISQQYGLICHDFMQFSRLAIILQYQKNFQWIFMYTSLKNLVPFFSVHQK